MIQERLKLLIEFKIVQYRNKKTGSHLVLHPHKKLYLSRLSGLADIEKYKGININEKIFRYLWDDNIEHTCRICSESVELHTLGSGWREFCSKKCVEVFVKDQKLLTTKGYRHSEKTRKKMSLNHADISGDKNPFKKSLQDPQNRENHKVRCKLIWEGRDTTWRNKFSVKVSKSLAKSEFTKNCNFHKNHKAGFFFSNKTGKEYFYRSSWEEYVLNYIEKCETITYYALEDSVVPYLDLEGHLRYTRIDFYIKFLNGKEIIFDVKPLRLLIKILNNKNKMNGLKQYCKKQHIQYKYLSGRAIHNDALMERLVTKALKGAYYATL